MIRHGKTKLSAWWFLALVLMISPLAAAENSPGGILKDLDGAFHGVDEFTGKGKWTVVMLWASDCHVCNQEAGEYVKFHEAHKDQDATVLGISLDGDAKREDARQFIKRHELSFPNLIGQPWQVAQFYNAMTGKPWVGTPTFMVYAPDGELRGAQVGAIPTEIIEAFIARETIEQ